MIDDVTLLRRYASEREEEAFTELVRRNLPLVYSAALRRLGGDAHRAQDVAQVVFCSLARDAHRISRYPVLSGWLYTSTRNAVIDLVRADQRRRVREEEAQTLQEVELESEAPADWTQIRPVLDGAMDQLSEKDREAILLRFFQDRTFAEIGPSIGVSEDAARKRVDRALDKLRDVLRHRGLVSSSATLMTLLASQSIVAAPAGLATSIASAALVTGATATAGVTAFLALTKVQVGIAAALVVGGTAVLVTQSRTVSPLPDDRARPQLQMGKVAAENQTPAQQSTRAEAPVSSVSTETSAPQKSPLATTVTPPGVQTKSPPLAGPERSGGGAAVPADALPPLPATQDIDRQRAALHRRYDPFLRSRGLTAIQGNRFVDLLIHQENARQNLQTTVLAKGMTGGTPEVEAMRKKLYAPVVRELNEMLGGEGYRGFTEYSTTSFFRLAFVEPLIPQFAATPLSAEQVEGLVRAIAASDHPERAKPTDVGSVARIDWNAVVAQARGFLSPVQLAVLQTHAARQPAPKR